MPEDEITSLYARLAVGGSAEVVAVVRSASERVRAFGGAVMAFEGVRDQGAAGLADARRAMDDVRAGVYTAIDTAETVMREELAQL